MAAAPDLLVNYDGLDEQGRQLVVYPCNCCWGNDKVISLRNEFLEAFKCSADAFADSFQ